MSALIRYFLAKGYPVAGYDKTPSPLTEELIKEGAQIVYDENPRLIPSDFKDPKNTLVVYTPAVPESHAGMIWFKENGFEIVTRPAARNDYPYKQGVMFCRDSWKNAHIQHGGTYICTISDRMQRLSRRNTEKLRQQSDSFRS